MINNVAIDLSPDDPLFCERLYLAIAKQRKQTQMRDGDNLKRVCAEEYEEISALLDLTGIQQSCSVRNILRTRRLANLLVTDKGELNSSLLPLLIQHMSNHTYSLRPDGQDDTKRNQQILKVIKLLQENKNLVIQLKRIGKPHSNPVAEELIRSTLQLAPSVPITDAHARRAVLSALMCTLRQSIGSCFATAPSILVHDEQPEQFLSDIQDLLSIGRIKRTFGGIEYVAPLNSSWGAGDLRRNLLLIYGYARSEVWKAPGLIISLEAIALLDPESTFEEKSRRLKQLFTQAFPEWNEQQPYLFVSIEEILKRILMKELNLTNVELDAYEQRPRDMIYSDLLIQSVPSKVNKGVKGDVYAQFYHLLAHASSAFKGLTDNALLRAWEFTIASFSETKSEFARWNLYASLGLQPQEPGGIGQAIYQIIQEKLNLYNSKVQEIQFEYEQVFTQLKQLEGRIRHASSEQEAQWIRVEYQSRTNEFHTLEEIRNKTHDKAALMASLFDVLIGCYDKLFPQYFQEVYDPDLHEVQVGPFDDSPAGFRLLFKHGRASTAQWTKIKTAHEYVDALSKFFVASENELVNMEELEPVRDDLIDIVTSVVTHIKTQEFLETSFHRMAIAHHTAPIAKPLENLDKIAMKPWAYVSGGTINTLLSCYYRREQKLTEMARWVENPMELLVFLVDNLKQVPYKIMDTYVYNPDKSMLIHSPTHAFLLKPGFELFQDAWHTEAFSYTWVRDKWVRPRERFVEEIELDEEMVEFFVQKLASRINPNFQPYFRKVFSNQLKGKMSPGDFYEYLMDKIIHERGLQYNGQLILGPEEINSVLYTSLPLFPRNQLKERLNEIWNLLSFLTDSDKEKLNEAVDLLLDKRWEGRLLDAEMLHNLAILLIGLTQEKTSMALDLPALVSQASQKLGYAMPAPILFADTNWIRDFFAFVVSPTSKALELWRTDLIGRKGAPMLVWKEWLNGSRKDRTWGFYPYPYEYTPAEREVRGAPWKDLR